MLLVFPVLIPLVHGVPTLNTTETWNNPDGSLSNWTYAVGSPPGGGASSVAVDSIGGQTAVHVTFAAQGSPAAEDEKIYAVAGSSGPTAVFAGDQSYVPPGEGYLLANFSFYADDYTTPADTLAFFFYSSTGNRTWKYSLPGPATIDNWATYNVPIQWSASWTTPGGTEAMFNSDMTDVDQIGIWVYRASNLPAQNYGLDDFEITWQVPEPSTYVMLAFTLLTLGITLRKKQIFSFQPVRTFFAGR